MKLSTRDYEGIAKAISENKPFNTHGSLRGAPQAEATYAGWLAHKYLASYRDADYVIWSYQTPIAWRTQGQWIQPADKYSVTTSKQQGTVRRALRMLDVYPRVINGRTVWACCESTIGPVCEHQSA
jgi:hypothetical protein